MARCFMDLVTSISVKMIMHLITTSLVEMNMEYLKLPSCALKYRSTRSHVKFLCRMKEHAPSRSTFIERTIKSLGSYFLIRPFQLDELAGRPSTVFDQELKDACSSQCEDSRLLALIRITY
ncbi:unnamed protein product [Musa hybrid cultivar]